MKKIFFITFIFFLSAVDLSSQELNDAYLESLPEDVRNDVLKKIEEDRSKEDPIYRRASTNVYKDLLEDEDEEEIPYQKSVFGSDFFKTIQSSFMPINEPNLDSSYILDFGDVLRIQLTGQIDSIDSYLVTRDGSINIPDIGKIIVSGLSLKDASDLIKLKVINTYIGTEAFTTLENIRDITVLIAGNAFNPGVYTLNGNTNMLHALSMAGGINEFGSYRSIDLIRNGELIDTLDIYDLLISGKHNLYKGLRSGDSIVVNPQKNILSIESGVMRPGRYEIDESDSFEDILRYANGFSKNVNKNNIQIKRLSNGTSSIVSIDIEDLYSFKFIDNDSLFISEYKYKYINIEGAVKNPGNYILSQQATLSELIITAGGYEESAYPFGGYLENKNALIVNEESKSKLYDKFLNNYILNSRSLNLNSESMTMVLEQIQDSPVTGRVIAEFDLDLIKNNPSLDTILEDGDKIMIPYITQQVYIHGEVSNPGALRYSENKDIDYYINSSGGSLKNADLKNIFVVHPNGETTNLAVNNRLSFLQADSEKILIYPGSIIYVPQSADLSNSIEVASVWAPILSSIALSITSLSVLNNSN